MTSNLPSEYHIPVCISDLAGYNFIATPDTLTEEIVSEFENNPTLPGVMIIDNQQLVGIISRMKLFERLAHRFGVELFMQKPIHYLKDLIRTHAQILPGHLRIDEAIQYALSRYTPDIYDPIVVLTETGSLKLLDINALLLAQSRAMASLSNIVGNLEQLDRLIYSERGRQEIFNKLLHLLRQVIPYHQAAILLVDEKGMTMDASTGYAAAHRRVDSILESDLYKMLINHRQSIYLPRACTVPAWKGMEVIGSPLSWLGVPLLSSEKNIGLLSISRDVERPFSPGERDTALAFAQRIIDLRHHEQHLSESLLRLSQNQPDTSLNNKTSFVPGYHNNSNGHIALPGIAS